MTLIASLADAAESRALTVKDVPKAVHEAFQKTYPNAKSVKYSQQQRDGKSLYEIEFKDQGREREVLYDADATLVQTEEEIKARELPEAVLQGVKQTHPKATVKEAEKILQPDAPLGVMKSKSSRVARSSISSSIAPGRW
ncbi:PepSY-like domain-containing protein [Candidatus Methylocalor cossyra]|uniref:Putative beta-lactamase-inhibitor-like PepSY-like domain-containing protein n=1 Tax=Candidatus Methylocalor cossyra TaxID=3108543 RepID=A0ABM9NF94_9GAMM